MVWKEIKIFTADGEQSVSIQPNEEQTGLCLESREEVGNGDGKGLSFLLYMNYDEARTIGEELVKYADEMTSSSVKN